MPHLDHLIDQIAVARRYTLKLLENVPYDNWFRQPSEGVTHVAWQVGHLATAEFHLALQRLRGRRSEDQSLIQADFVALFGRGSAPDPDPASYPTPAEIREVLDRVHQQVILELEGLPESVLSEATDKPHPMFSTKEGALTWCAQHELVHAGQIALLRRLLGHAPIW